MKQIKGLSFLWIVFVLKICHTLEISTSDKPPPHLSYASWISRFDLISGTVLYENSFITSFLVKSIPKQSLVFGFWSGNGGFNSDW
jgi:hypothetical protein